MYALTRASYSRLARNQVVIIMSTQTYYAVLTEAVKAQGTIDRANKRMNEAKSGVSHELFMAAQDTAAQDVDKFIAFCTEAEAQYKASKRKGSKVVIPKHWTQAKSNIKGALNAGLNLKDFETESAMRKKLNELRKGVDVFAAIKDAFKSLKKAGRETEAKAAIADATSVLEVMLAMAEEAQAQAEVKAEDKPAITAAA